MYLAPDRTRAVIHKLHDVFAEEQQAATLLRQVRDQYPQAFAALVAFCRSRHNEELTAAQEALPPAFDDLPEGNLDDVVQPAQEELVGDHP